MWFVAYNKKNAMVIYSFELTLDCFSQIFLKCFDHNLRTKKLRTTFDCFSQIFLKYADHNPYNLYSNSDHLLFTHLLTK